MLNQFAIKPTVIQIRSQQTIKITNYYTFLEVQRGIRVIFHCKEQYFVKTFLN